MCCQKKEILEMLGSGTLQILMDMGRMNHEFFNKHYKSQRHHQRKIKARTKTIEEQDILFMQAQESGADTTAILAEKQRLRNITNAVDTCTTTDELKALSCTEENE